MKKRILSGAQPSGQLHIGNYFGMIERMVQFQDDSDLFCFVANYHSMTSIHDKAELEHNRIVSKQYHKFMSNKNSEVRKIMMEGFVELDESIHDQLGALRKHGISRDSSSNTSTNASSSADVLQTHILISSIRSSVQAKLLLLSEKRNHEIQLQLEEAKASRQQYEGKLKVAWDRNRSLQHSHQVLEDRLEELDTALTYHRIASERLRSTERNLEHSERERISLERQLSNLRSAHEKVERQTAKSSFTDKKSTTNNRERNSGGGGGVFEDDEDKFYFAEPLDVVMKALDSESDENLTVLEERSLLLSARLREIRERRLKARTEELEKRHEAIDSSLCCVCVEYSRSVLLLPCRHLCVCENCANSPQLNSKCPVCRSSILDTIKVYCA